MDAALLVAAAHRALVVRETEHPEPYGQRVQQVAAVHADLGALRFQRAGEPQAGRLLVAEAPAAHHDVAVLVVEGHAGVRRIVASKRRQHLGQHGGVRVADGQRLRLLGGRNDLPPVRERPGDGPHLIVPARRHQPEPAALLVVLVPDLHLRGRELAPE